MTYCLYENTKKGEVLHSFTEKNLVVEFLKEKLCSIVAIVVVNSKGDVFELSAIAFLLLFSDFIEFK